jgi:hypothetical protein
MPSSSSIRGGRLMTVRINQYIIDAVTEASSIDEGWTIGESEIFIW